MPHLFDLLYSSWGPHSKYPGVVCHSLCQWITFCQNSLLWPVRLGWPCTARLIASLSCTSSFTMTRQWFMKEKRASEDEMAGWHHHCNGHELGETSGDDEGQGGLVCCCTWGCKESDTTGWLNNTERHMGFSGGSVVKNPPANAGDASSIPRRKWQPTPVFLHGKSYGQRSLGKLQSMRLQKVRHDLDSQQQLNVTCCS